MNDVKKIESYYERLQAALKECKKTINQVRDTAPDCGSDSEFGVVIVHMRLSHWLNEINRNFRHANECIQDNLSKLNDMEN